MLFAWLTALAVTLAPAWLPTSGQAHAALAVALDLDELVAGSEACIVGRAAERRSEWVELGGGRRIVTYTRIDVERTVFGRERASVWVRTLGGGVDGIGQVVSGEARLRPGQRALLFLRRAPDRVFTITALAQGHYPLVEHDGVPATLAPSPDPGTLVGRSTPLPQPTARERLVGRALDDVTALVREAKARLDATP
ncbi:MAG: hypothetical protein HY908_05030 [Myxococcales bacterium]|nr:hypothetical protein [Myxococcales bacterium]